VGVPLGRRPLREPRRVRAGAPPLPADHRLRRRQDGDVTFEDLGNAIERCRADFGVDIEIDLATCARRRSPLGVALRDRHHPLRPAAAEQGGRSARGPGTLLYIKSSLTGDEPADVLRYAAEHPGVSRTSPPTISSSTSRSSRAIARSGFHAVEDVFMRAVARRGVRDAAARRDLHAGAAALGQAGAGATRRGAEVLGRARTHLDRRAHARRSRSSTARCFPEMPR
jgi:hypothetical protein